MKYCMHCGGVVRSESDTKFICENCGYQHYVNPKASVGVILHKGDGIVVLSRRKFDPYRGELDIIGGFLDYGETNEQAIERELEEEVGLAPSNYHNLRYLTSASFEYPWQDKLVNGICAAFIADIDPSVELHPNDDVAGVEDYDLRQDFAPEDFPDEWMHPVLVACKQQLLR